MWELYFQKEFPVRQLLFKDYGVVLCFYSNIFKIKFLKVLNYHKNMYIIVLGKSKTYFLAGVIQF